MEELDKAIKQLQTALNNINKAEEKAFNNHQDDLSDDLENISDEVSSIKSKLHILNCKVKYIH